MKTNLSILLFVFSIIGGLSTECYADNPTLNPDAVASPEAIPQHYVKIEIPVKKIAGFSPEQVLQNFSNWSESLYYSLLNWKKQSRSEVIMADSYDRVHHFGHWVNDYRDQSCFNTRAKVLIRDSVKSVVFEKANPCSVESGKWNDPYANKILRDARSEVQIDHMVPLKNAYVSGAYKWNFQQRCLYGNYLGASFHLISVDGTENIRKSSAGPDGYMPPNKEYRCTYLKNWLLIKTLWGLEMTVSEAQAIKDAIASENCSPSSFRISAAEINRQQKFAADNAELCAKVNP